MIKTPLERSGDVVLGWRRVLTILAWSSGVDWQHLTQDEARAFLFTWPRNTIDPDD
jgi:hypothetical protein